VIEYSVEGYGASTRSAHSKDGKVVLLPDEKPNSTSERAAQALTVQMPSLVHSAAQTAHEGDVTERPPVREPNGELVARQPFPSVM